MTTSGIFFYLQIKSDITQNLYYTQLFYNLDSKHINNKMCVS